MDLLQGQGQVLEVQQGFTDAHDHHAPQLSQGASLGELLQDLVGLEVARQPVQPRGAERAGDRAADLGRDAQGRSLAALGPQRRDVDDLNTTAFIGLMGGKVQEELGGAVPSFDPPRARAAQ